jgi:hypothetical protein
VQVLCLLLLLFSLFFLKNVNTFYVFLVCCRWREKEGDGDRGYFFVVVEDEGAHINIFTAARGRERTEVFYGAGEECWCLQGGWKEVV